jgi:hypothetical protein
MNIEQFSGVLRYSGVIVFVACLHCLHTSYTTVFLVQVEIRPGLRDMIFLVALYFKGENVSVL